MYRPDLSPFGNPTKYKVSNALCVGWLDKKYPYPKGEVSEIFLKQLFDFCRKPIVVTAGWHLCTFCQKRGDRRIREIYNNRKIDLGKGQIHVFYENVVYVAPTLVFHYVVRHEYKPPDEFINAVIKGISLKSYLDGMTN